VVALVIALMGLAVRANTYGSDQDNPIEFVSGSLGIARGQTVSISVVVYVGRPISNNDPVSARIQLLDTEGEVIVQSDEISVAPGQTRSWDVPRELLPAGDSTGRIQVRARILVTTQSVRRSPPLEATLELIDTTSSRSVIWLKFRDRQEFPEGLD
jgi:hypothetical protein